MLSAFLKEVCARFVDLLGILVMEEKTEVNISKQNSSNEIKKDKLNTQLVSIVKELIQCYKDKVELENTPAWIKLVTIDNLCELGYHFFQCFELLSLFDESLFENAIGKFIDLLLPAFPPLPSIEQDSPEELTEEQTLRRKCIAELKNLSQSLYTYCDTVSEDEVSSHYGIRTIQQYIHLLKSTLRNMHYIQYSSRNSVPETAEAEIQSEVRENQANPVNEEGEPVVYEGESERPIEATTQSIMYSTEDIMAPPSVISEIHSQIFNRAPNGPRGLADESNRQSSHRSSHRRSSKRSEKKEEEEKKENEPAEEKEEEDGTATERTEEKEKDQKENDRSKYIVYSVNSNEPDYGQTSIPEPALDYIMENFHSFVIYEANGEITCKDTQNILNRLRTLRHSKKLDDKGGFSMNGGVIRYRDRHGNGAGGRSMMRDIVDRRIPGKRIRDTEASADGTNGPTNRRRYKRAPDVVFGGRDGVIYPSQFANRLRRNGNGNENENENKDGNGNENENEEADWSSSESSDSEFLDHTTPEELLSYMMFNPMTVTSIYDQIPLDNYVPTECPVSNKHAQNMIQIHIIKCTT